MIRILYILISGVLVFTSCATQKKVSTKESESYEVTALFLDASKQKLIGNYDKAIDLLQLAGEKSPENGAIQYELSQVYTYKSSFSFALKHAENAVKLDDKNKWYLLQLAYLYKTNGLHREALSTFEKLHKLEPQNLNYAFSLADAYLYVGEAKKAIQVISEVEQQIGINEELSYQKRDLYLKMGDKKNALSTIQKLRDSDPDNLMYLGALAETHQMIGELDKAELLFKQLIELEPKNGIAHFSLFQIYVQKQEDLKAIEALKKSFVSNDLNIDLKVDVLLKMYEMQSSAYKEAGYQLLDIMEQTHSDDAKTYSIYGDFLSRDRRVKEAINKYRKACELDPSKYAIWSQLILLEADLNDFDLMVIDSKKAMELFPSQPSFYLFNGIANLQKKNAKEALESLNAGKMLVVEDDIVLAQFHQYLAEGYHQTKAYEKSDKYFDLYLSKDPNNATVLNNYSYYLSVRKEKLGKAEEMIKKADKMYPNNATFLDTYGWVLYQQGKYKEAEEKLSNALKYGGDNSGEILEHYGDVQYQLGNKTMALEYWNKALEKGEYSDDLERKINEKQL